MKYFAYGSNLFLPRLRKRVPSAEPIITGWVEGYQLRFQKKSKDGSAKCNLKRTEDPTSKSYGVVFEIRNDDKAALDRVEGLGSGYEEEDVQIQTQKGPLTSFAYIAGASFIEDNLSPYHWYKEFVLHGAQDFRLPRDYIRVSIASVKSIADPDPNRVKDNRRILSKRILRGWHNGSPSSSGAGYGLRLSKEARSAMIQRDWRAIEIDLGKDEILTIRLSPAFWSSRPELRKKELGLWLLQRDLAPWPKGKPPILILEPISEKRFKLTC